MGIWVIREIVNIKRFRREEVSELHRAQRYAVYAIDSELSTTDIERALEDYALTSLYKIFSSLKGDIALALYNTWKTIGEVERKYLRDALEAGRASLGHMLEELNIAPHVFEIEVQVPFLRLELDDGSTVTYLQGNEISGEESRGYILRSVRTEAGWIDM